ncbi:MAG: ferredoxin family protein [Nannocystaceae bacterium]
MALVITQKCQGTCAAACVPVCPMDCIHGPVELAALERLSPAERRERHPSLQLFINPEECIDCFACVPQCPVEAIYPDDALPEAYAEDGARNAAFFRERPLYNPEP